MSVSKEGRDIFKRFCLIGLGIPAMLLIFITALCFSPLAIGRSQVSTSTLNIALACLAVAGLGIWAFFSFLLYRRLWKVFPYISEREKGWTYAEGVFGFLGVGASMSSVLGVFYYLFSGDFSRGAVLAALSFVLAGLEMARFPDRIDDVEKMIAGME